MVKFRVGFKVQDAFDTPADAASIVERLYSWRAQQSALFPLLRPLPDIDEADFASTKLLLPSSFPPNERVKYGLEGAAKVEARLRQGRAYDILRALREEIYIADHLILERNIDPNSNDTRTRNRKALETVKDRQKALLRRYEEVRCVLGVLGSASDLQPITVNDLWVKSPLTTHQLGDSSKLSPWYWSIGKPTEMSEQDWVVESE